MSYTDAGSVTEEKQGADYPNCKDTIESRNHKPGDILLSILSLCWGVGECLYTPTHAGTCFSLMEFAVVGKRGREKETHTHTQQRERLEYLT